jgi:hypothetical protein
VVRAGFEPLPSSAADRATQLAENGLFKSAFNQWNSADYRDYLIHTLLDSRPSANYTIIYTTTPVSAEIVDDLSYKPVFIEPLHMELKRFDDKPPNDTEKDDRPLFEKYQFFTPGT